MNFKKRLLITIGAPLSICLILVLGLFFVGSDISQKVNKIRELRGDLLFRTGLTNSLAILSQQSETAKNYDSQLQNILPSGDQLIAFPKNIISLAKQNNLNINATLGQKKSQEEEGLQQTEFNIEGQGPFENFVNFLKSLESSQYFISLKTIDVIRQNRDFGLMMSGSVFSL